MVRDPGEVLQIDINSLGRITGGARHDAIGTGRRTTAQGRIGFEHAHVAVDAASRRTYVELRAGRSGEDCAAFLRAAVAEFDAIGIRVQRVLTDNGAGYKRTFAAACASVGVRHTHTRPDHPWTNGRVERFIGTVPREFLYDTHFETTEERRYALTRWLAFYNGDRPHTALGGLSPERWLRARGVTYV